MSGFDCDVIVVGLGPVGAALAALLVQQDLSVIAIDKDVDVYPMPRAAHFDHEIMRLFQHLLHVGHVPVSDVGTHHGVEFGSKGVDLGVEGHRREWIIRFAPGREESKMPTTCMNRTAVGSKIIDTVDKSVY